MDQNNEFSRKIENNLQLLITVSIFFLTIFESVRLGGCILVVGYIANYIVFELKEKRYTISNLTWIRRLLLIGLGSYAIPLFILALSTQDKTFGPLVILTLKTAASFSTFAIVSVPAITLFMATLLPGHTFKKIFVKA